MLREVLGRWSGDIIRKVCSSVSFSGGGGGVYVYNIVRAYATEQIYLFPNHSFGLLSYPAPRQLK